MKIPKNCPLISPLVCGLLALSFLVPAYAEKVGSEKALKYHELLLKRPDSEVIFTRFYDEWLIHASIEELEQFLVQRTEVGDAGDWHVLAVFHLQRGEEAKALEAYQSATERAPEDGRLWLSRAESAKALQDYEQALENLDRALSCELAAPQVLKARRLKGSCLALSGRNQEANAVWQKLLEDFPDDHELMEDLIDLQIGEGMLDEALSTALKLVASTKDPYQKALYQIDLGDIYIRQEERSKAQAHLSDLIDKVGSGSWLEKEILAKIDLLVSGMNDLNAALGFYRELRERYPRRVEIWKRSIQAQAAGGDVEAATEQYRELLRLTPGDRQNHEAFIDFLVRNERLEHAAENSLKLCELYPQDAELRLRHAALLDRLEEREALLETLQAYEALLGDAPNERLQAARVYDEFGFYEQSGPIYKALAGGNRNDVESVENYAIWLFRRGQEDEAIKLLESLAKEVDREGLIRLCRTLKSQLQGEKAYALLKSRLDDYKTDSLYLLELSHMALSQSVPEEALGWVRTLVLKAESPFELSSAVNLAVSVIQRAEQVDALLAELDAADELNVQELCLKAHLEKVSGDSLSADATIERLRQEGGVIAYSEISRILEMQGRLDEAVEAMETLIAMDAGRNPLNLRRIVGLLQQLGSWDRAVEYVDAWKTLTPGDPRVWLREADLLEAAGRSQEAIRQMRRGLYKFEGDLDLTLRLAALYQSGNEYAEAARIYWRLYNQEEKDAERLRWISELARLNQARGTSDELIEKLTAMRKQQRESIFPLLALAEVYRQNNDTEQYRESLVEASNLQPDNPELLRQVASLHESYGDLSAAEEALQRLVRIDGDTANVNALSGFYLRMGETEKAYNLIFQSAPAGGHTPRDLESIIDSLAASSEWEIALEQAESAAAKFPEDWRIGYLLGVCLEANGRGEEAFQQWLALLGPQQEMSDLPQPTQTHRRSFYGYHAQLMQDEMSEAAKIIQDSSRTFSYLSQNSNRQPHYGAGLSGFGMPQIALPVDTESLRSMCALQMAAMAADWPGERQLQAVRDLRRAGLDAAPLLVALGGGRSPQSLPVRLLAYIEENPEDAEAFPLLLGFIQRGSFVPEDILQRGYEIYAADNPRIASEFALALLMREPEGNERYLDHIVRYVSFEDEATINHSNSLLQRMLALAYGNANAAASPELGESHLAALREKTEAYYDSEAAQSTDPQKMGRLMQSFNVLAFLYIKQGASKDFVRLLEEQLTRFESMATGSPGMGYNPYTHHSARYNNLQLQMPAFEQSYLELANPAITRYLAKPGTANRGYQGAVLGSDEWHDLDLVGHVDDFSRPELKILVYWLADDIEGCEKMFEQLLAGAPEPHHLYVYATWLLEIKKDKLAAVRTLEQALKHPEARAIRPRYEQGIVAIVLDMIREQDIETIDPDVLQTARSAMLRLRKSLTLRSYQQQFYVNALNELGLVEEAERMLNAQRSGTLLGSSTRSGMGFAPTTPRRSNPMDRITELASKGKTAAATSEAVREIRRMMQQANRHSPPQLKQVVQRINGVRLVDEVLQRFDPGESKSRRRMETYAMLLDYFGRAEEAKELWSTLHELRPEEPSYQLELILRQEGESRLQAIRELTQIDSLYEDDIGEWIVRTQNFSQRNQDLESWMALLEFAVDYLEELEPETEKYRNLTWVPHYAVNVGSRVYLGRTSFGDILRPNQRNRQGDEAIRERRRENFLGMVDAMQRHPQTSEEAFMLRHAFDTNQGNAIEQEVYEPLALQSIENEAALKTVALSQIYYGGSSSRWTYVSRGRHHHGGRRLDNEMSPLNYLMQLYQHETDKGISCLRALREKVAGGNPKLATTIETYVDLLGMGEAEFVAACEEWSGGLAHRYGSNEYILSLLPYLIEAREMDGEALLDLVQRIQAPILAQGNSGNINQFLGKISDLLAAVDDKKLIEEWLESVTVEYLGPKEGWQDFITRWGWGRTYYGGNHPGQKVRMLRQFFGRIASSNRELAIATFRFTKKHQIGMQSHATRGLGSKLNQGFESVEEAMAWCDAQGLLSSIEEFDALLLLDEQVFRDQVAATGSGQVPLLPLNRNASVYEQALAQISFVDDDKKEKRKAYIDELKQQDFGGIFLAAMLEGKSSGKKTALEALEGKLDAVRGMSEAEQAELAFLYDYWFAESIFDEEAHPELYHVQSRLLVLIEEEVAAYLAKTGGVGQPQSSHQERQKIQAWLSSLLRRDMATCLKLYGKWLEKSEQASRMSINYSKTQAMNNNRSLLIQAIRPFRNASEGLEPSIRFTAALLEEGLGDSFGDLHYISHQIRDSWRTAIDAREKEAAKSGIKEHSGFVPDLLSEFDALWKTDREAQFAALTLWSYAIERMRVNDKELEDLVVWASGVAPGASLSHRVFAAAITALAEIGDQKLENGAARAAALFASDAIDVEIRMAFWRSLFSSRLRELPEGNAELNRLYVVTMQEFLEAGHEPLRRDFLNNLGQLATLEVASENRDAYEACFAELQDRTPKVFGRGDQNEIKKYYDALAKIAMKIGDLDAVKTLVNSHHWALQGNTVLFVELIRAAEYQAALRLMPDAFNFKLDNSIRYDAALHEKLPDFLEKVSNEQLRYRAKAALMLLRDDGGLKKAEIPEQKARAQALIGALEPGDSLLSAELLNEIAKNISETELIIDHIKEIVGEMDLGTLIEQANDNSFGRTQAARAELDLLEKLLEHEVKAGEITGLTKHVFSVEGRMHDRNVQRYYKKLQQQFDEHLKALLERGDRKAQADVAPLAEILLNMAYSQESTARDLKPYFSYLITQLANPSESVVATRAKLPESTRERIQELEGKWEQPEKIFSLVDDFAGRGSSDTEKKRRQEILHLMLADQEYIQNVWVTSADALFDSLGYSSKYEQEDIIAVVPKLLSQDHPREPWLAIVLADAYSENGGHVEETKKWLAYTIEASGRHPDLKDVSSEAAFRLAKISLDVDQDAEAALKYLEQVSPDSLSKKMKIEAEVLKEQASAVMVPN